MCCIIIIVVIALFGAVSSSFLLLRCMFGDKSVHMARPQWGSLMVRLLFPIKQEGTMAEATQETELDAELKQLRDFYI